MEPCHPPMTTPGAFRLLIITHESVGEKMAGPGIRAWEMARALGRCGVPVTLASPFGSNRSTDNVSLRTFDWDNPSSLFQLIEASDAVMGTGPVIARIVDVIGEPITKPTLLDLYDVAEIERIMLHTSTQQDFDPTQDLLFEMSTYLRQGDFFFCALEKQYDLWLGALISTGRINRATLGAHYSVKDLIDIVPFGIPDVPPVHRQNRIKGVIPGIGSDDLVMFWGGGIWNWSDPLTLMDALKTVIAEHPNIRMVFGALHHFENNLVPKMSVAHHLLERIKSEGWLNKHVFFLDWIPYDQRGEYLLEADLGVSLNLETIENRFAIRARLLDYLWAGLPCVLTGGDEMATLLEKAGLAALVMPGDATGLTQAINSRLNTSIKKDISSRPYPPASNLYWDHCIQPILRFMAAPHISADGAEARLAIKENRSLRHERDVLKYDNEILRKDIETLRHRKVVRIADAVGQFWLRLRGKRQPQ